MLVTTSPEFKNLLPELSPEELTQLEKNCLSDPKHMRMPHVLLWENNRNTVVDGHHQLALRKKHKLIVRYAKLKFATADEAIMYSLNAQFGRRNLSASQRAIVMAPFVNGRHGGDRKSAKRDQEVKLPLEKVAEKAGVSVKTMQDAVKVQRTSAATAKEILNGDGSVSKAAAKVRGPRQKPARNGVSVVSGKAKATALESCSKLVRALHELGIFDEFNNSISQIIKRVKTLK